MGAAGQSGSQSVAPLHAARARDDGVRAAGPGWLVAGLSMHADRPCAYCLLAAVGATTLRLAGWRTASVGPLVAGAEVARQQWLHMQCCVMAKAICTRDALCCDCFSCVGAPLPRGVA